MACPWTHIVYVQGPTPKQISYWDTEKKHQNMHYVVLHYIYWKAYNSDVSVQQLYPNRNQLDSLLKYAWNTCASPSTPSEHGPAQTFAIVHPVQTFGIVHPVPTFGIEHPVQIYSIVRPVWTKPKAAKGVARECSELYER